MNLKPLPGQVLVLPIEVTMVGVIHIVGADHSTITQEAYVVAVGDTPEGEVAHVKFGDRVLINKRGGRDAHVNGKRHLLFKEREIYAVLEPQ